MGTWQISADLLARSRFVVSPRIETVGVLNDLVRPSDPEGRALAAAHGEAFRTMLDAHPVRRAVLDHSWKPHWISDWLCLPPTTGGRSFAEELGDVRDLGDDLMRHFLAESSPTRVLPDALLHDGLTEHGVALLDWVWTHVLATDWARRERILRADVVARTSRLAEAREALHTLSSLARRDWRRRAGQRCCAISAATASGSATGTSASTTTTCRHACSPTTPTSSSSP